MSQDRRSRREFMNLTGATVAGVVGAPFVGGSATVRATQAAVGGGTDPDLIVVNAKVYTMDPRSPRAEAFAVTNGRFVGGRQQRRHHGPGRARRRRPSTPRA